VDAAAQAVADFLIEPSCHACGARVTATPPPGSLHPAVAGLGVPVTIRAAGVSVQTRLLCDRCLRSVRPWPDPLMLPVPSGRGNALPVFPAFLTDDAVLALVHLLKFGRAQRIAPWIGAAMAQGIPARAARRGTVLVPVPMDRASRRRRGFNQAERIAAELARRWNLTLRADALVKPAPTVAQSRLDRADRLRNLTGTFRAGPGAAGLWGRPVLLVDDLVTTGSTAHACAAALAAAGAGPLAVASAGYRP
jgi:predicted amidophosphoribosyltransferase